MTGPSPVTFTVNGAGGTGGGFAGSGTDNYSVLGISPTQAGQQVTLSTPTTTPGIDQPGSGQSYTMTIADALADFQNRYTTDPAFASTMEDQLYRAGLLSDSVYNSGATPTPGDLYNAYKYAVVHAAAAHVNLDQYIANAVQSFQAQGGPKVKLPTARYSASLTSYDDMSAAADAAFQKVLGHMAPVSIKQALTKELNSLELSGKNQEASSAYSQMLALRGINPDGTQTLNGLSDQPANAAIADTGTATQITNPQQMAQAASSNAGPPTGPTNQQGSAVTPQGGAIVTAYAAPPSPENLAYETALSNNPNEVNGRLMAGALQSIVQFMSKPQGQA